MAYGPPVCAYGYYPYYPYACSPYGYYGPSWFAGGIFIGAGPWYHGWYGRGPWYGYGHGGWYGHPGYGYGGRPIATPYRGYNGYNGGRTVYANNGYRGTYNNGYGVPITVVLTTEHGLAETALPAVDTMLLRAEPTMRLLAEASTVVAASAAVADSMAAVVVDSTAVAVVDSTAVAVVTGN